MVNDFDDYSFSGIGNLIGEDANALALLLDKLSKEFIETNNEIKRAEKALRVAESAKAYVVTGFLNVACKLKTKEYSFQDEYGNLITIEQVENDRIVYSKIPSAIRLLEGLK